MQGQDVGLLLKLAIEDALTPGKQLADALFISPSEVSKSIKRCVATGLLHIGDGGKRVNRSGLLEFLKHGLRYTFPPIRGSMVRGVPTAAAAEPLKSRFVETSEPADVWPFAIGTVRGISFEPLYRGAPKAALKDPKFYQILALCDALRGGRTRERNLAIEFLEKELHG